MNIKDIAKAAGVSISSVSRVLNNVPGVRPEVRLKVQSIIHSSGYTPNLLAKGLAARHSQSIGVILPHVHSFWMPRIAAIVDFFQTQDYSVMINSYEKDPYKETAAFRLMEEKQVDGIIYFPHANGKHQHQLIKKYQDRIPLVIGEQFFPDLRLNYVLQDNEQGTQLLISHLLENGHRRFALISGPEDGYSTQQRRISFQTALQNAGIDLDQIPVKISDYSMQGGYTAMQEILRDKHLPSAVFAMNDLMALGALRAIHESGLKVPHDISLAGYDDIEWAGFSLPGLTTVRQEHQEAGRQCARMLLDSISNHSLPPSTLILAHSLIIRESTAQAAGEA